MSAHLQERLIRGAALLDLHTPGWAASIAPEALSVADVERCVLGQVYGCYRDGLTVLQVRPRDGWRYGFERAPGSGLAEREALTAGWRWLIEARVAGGR